MSKSTLTIKVIVDTDEAEEVANDFRRMYWNHRVGMHSYKSKIEEVPVSHCKACGDPIFKKTSNSLCEDTVCTRVRQIEFNDKKNHELDKWKKMMCDKCKEDPETDFCYMGDFLVNDDTICEGCIYDTAYSD